MIGFGLSSAGLSPYGTGTPIEGEARPTGEAGSRYINPTTGDYEQDETTKQLKQMPKQRQRVLLAVKTIFRSSTVYNGGIKLPTKMGTFFESDVKLAIRSVLRQMTDVEKVIRVDSIEVLRGANSRARAIIEYTDLTTGLQDKVSA